MVLLLLERRFCLDCCRRHRRRVGGKYEYGLRAASRDSVDVIRLLAKAESGILEAIVSRQRRRAQYECTRRERLSEGGGMGKMQLSINCLSPQEPRLDMEDQLDPLRC